jgi:glycosyltransferase involved in cell wall biosynthesis
MQLGSPTGLYGAERWILALVRHLSRADVESIVGVIRDSPGLAAPLCAEAERSGARSHIVEAPGRVNFSAVAQLRAYLLENDVHVLHTHGYKTDLVGLLATRATQCRIVSTPHGWSVQAGLALRIYESLDRLAFPFFDAVVPLSDALHAELAVSRRTRPRLHLIRNGVDISEIDAVQGIAQEVADWKRSGQFVIGYVGQLIARKGLATLLRAFARLPATNKKLALVGEGEQRAELEALAGSLGLGEHVRFFGFRGDRLSLMKGFDVFALPSHLEGIPRCLMESMAAGIPIVATDIPGCRDLVTHGDTGLLFGVDDIDGLVACLEQCRDADTRHRFAERGRALVCAKYSAESMAAQYSDLYRTLVPRAACAPA